MSNKAISESTFSDIVDFVLDKAVFAKKMFGNNSHSLTSKVNDFILTFPVFMSSSVPFENAEIVTKALEAKYANLLLVLFSNIQDPEFDSLNHIRKVHVNLGKGSILKLAQESSIYESVEKLIEKQAARNDITMRDHARIIGEEIKKMKFEPVKTSIADKDLSGEKYFTEADVPTAKVSKVDFLRPVDVNKLNNAAPVIITVNYYGGKGEMAKSMNIGVKAVIHLIDSDTITNKLINVDVNRGILNLVRASTGEISFAKDLLFNIDNIKKEAIQAARNKNSLKEWKRLENRSRMVKINRLTGLNTVQAISTIVISEHDAARMLEDNIDMNNSNTVANIIGRYSLLGLAKVDSELGMVDMMFDGDQTIETISLKSLASKKPQIDDLTKILGGRL